MCISIHFLRIGCSGIWSYVWSWQTNRSSERWFLFMCSISMYQGSHLAESSPILDIIIKKNYLPIWQAIDGIILTCIFEAWMICYVFIDFCLFMSFGLKVMEFSPSAHILCDHCSGLWQWSRRERAVSWHITVSTQACPGLLSTLVVKKQALLVVGSMASLPIGEVHP